MDYQKLADLLFPNIPTREEIEERYPKRNRKEGEAVTRFAPSPTGFVHIGNFMSCLIDYVLAKTTKGIFYLRNEDTDKTREVDTAVEKIMELLNTYDILPDEYQYKGETKGEYGPYIQSERQEIYQAFIKDLIKKGRAYPCFCTKEELNETREIQEVNKERIGYFGSYAKCRDLTLEEIEEKIKAGIPYVIRFRSLGDYNKRFVFEDLVRGNIEFPENDQDAIIMKSDVALPTYHFAHAVDDYLMQTTHVVRGEEWLSSVPLHIELFEALGAIPPKYIHNPLILKKDGERVRKISKRKDPEASMSFYEEMGYPTYSVIEALMTIINSNYEEWHTENPDKTFLDFPFSPKKMSTSGAFFDLEKLDNISKEYFAKLTAEEIYEGLLEYTQKYDPEFFEIIEKNKDYTISILNIERNTEKPRKDIAKYKDIKELFWYMYEEYFYQGNPYKNITENYKLDGISEYFEECYNKEDNEEKWFNTLKEFAEKYKYTASRKDYKANPENYNGTIAKFCEIIRVIITTSNMSPNLYDLLQLLGIDEIKKRFELFKSLSFGKNNT